ncbi:MAG: asparagine synthase-related protein [Nitrosotalea sp.]
MQEFVKELKSLVSRAVENCNYDCLALSGGLDSSILASCMHNKKITAFALVAKDFASKDLMYAQLVAKQNHLDLKVISANVEDLLSAAEETIKILQVFNPIEIRNNIVVYLTMTTAKDSGHNSIMTGDGADELFAGYNFFKRLTGQELDKDLERIWKVMHYPSKSISKSVGISLCTPFLDDLVSEYAKKIPSHMKVREERGIKYGKWILRKAFEDVLPESIAWREKDAMQDGSGTSGLATFLDNLIPDSIYDEKTKQYLEKDKVRLSSKESMYYYEIYRKYFDAPYNLIKSETKCPSCSYAVSMDSHFCRMCGTYPI